MVVELTMIIVQVYVDVFSIAILLLGGALACYGEISILSSIFIFSFSPYNLNTYALY